MTMERIKKAIDQARKDHTHSGDLRLASVNRIRSAQELTDINYTETQVIEVDPEILKSNRVLLGDSNDENGTAYKVLRTQVLQRMMAKGWNTLGITSCTPNNGKSLTAVNLAIRLSRELHHTVLLVDTDMRRPTIHKYFDFNPSYGISDYLFDDIPLKEILINPNLERLVLLPGKESVVNSSEILASPKMRRLVNDLKSRYPSRLILFDLPPVLATDDAIAFLPNLDATLLVVEDSRTKRDELKHTMELLKDINLLGTVLNKAEVSFDKYYSYYS